jgi:hypothetical protein
VDLAVNPGAFKPLKIDLLVIRDAVMERCITCLAQAAGQGVGAYVPCLPPLRILQLVLMHMQAQLCKKLETELSNCGTSVTGVGYALNEAEKDR